MAKAKPTKKSVPRNKTSKAKVGFIKKLSLKRTVLLSFSFAAVIVAVGLAGRSVWTQHELRAHAATWSTLYKKGNVKVSACKVGQKSVYGYVRKVKMVVDAGPGHSGVGNAYLYAKRGNSTVQSSKNAQWTYNRYRTGEVFTSEIFNDTYSIYVVSSQGKTIFWSSYRNPAYLANC